MLLRCYSVYDRKALQYHPPFFAVTDGSAIRSLSDLANDQNTSIGRHPGDFVLYFIGFYDDQKGLMQGVKPLEHVIDAQACVAQRPRQADMLGADGHAAEAEARANGAERPSSMQKEGF